MTLFLVDMFLIINFVFQFGINVAEGLFPAELKIDNRFGALSVIDGLAVISKDIHIKIFKNVIIKHCILLNTDVVYDKMYLGK